MPSQRVSTEHSAARRSALGCVLFLPRTKMRAKWAGQKGASIGVTSRARLSGRVNGRDIRNFRDHA